MTTQRKTLDDVADALAGFMTSDDLAELVQILTKTRKRYRRREWHGVKQIGVLRHVVERAAERARPRTGEHLYVYDLTRPGGPCQVRVEGSAFPTPYLLAGDRFRIIDQRPGVEYFLGTASPVMPGVRGLAMGPLPVGALLLASPAPLPAFDPSDMLRRHGVMSRSAVQEVECRFCKRVMSMAAVEMIGHETRCQSRPNARVFDLTGVDVKVSGPTIDGRLHISGTAGIPCAAEATPGLTPTTRSPLDGDVLRGGPLSGNWLAVAWEHKAAGWWVSAVMTVDDPATVVADGPERAERYRQALAAVPVA